MKKKSKKIHLLLFMVIMLSLMITGCGNNEEEKIPKEADIKEITEKTIDGFLEISKIPRPSYHTEKALEYFLDFAESNGYEYDRDDYGNMWMDIPATEGYEDYPKVILQGHMDMVCVSEEGKEVDFENEGIEIIKDGNEIKADGTSLGADNGVGIAMMLAVTQSDAEHGPLRLLITTDEEVGLLGAGALPPEVLDTDYLINLDTEDLGEITYSNSGNENVILNKECEESSLEEGSAVFKISISGLKGGHSGSDIHKNRLSANVGLVKMINALLEKDIDARLISSDCGTANNVISPQGNITFAVSEESKENVSKILNKVKSSYEEEYPKEKIKFELEEMDASSYSSAITLDETKKIISLLKWLPQGVIEMSEKNEGVVATSMNLGVFYLQDGNCTVRTSYRSCITENIDKFEAKYKEKAEAKGFEFEIISKYPGYDGDPDTPLLHLTDEAFEKAGVEGRPLACHAGLESSWFASYREGIQMVCIGPTIKEPHSINETLYIDTVEPVVETVLYCLLNLDTLEE